MKRNRVLLPLLFGMFSMTQINVVGSIGITELVCYVCAPFVFIKDISFLRKDGFMLVIWLSIFAMIGCCLASWHNDTAMPFFLRGLAVTYSLFALPICMHRILRENLYGLRWILMGLCISMIINIFVFRTSVEVSMMSGGVDGAGTASLIMSGPLFWLQRLGGWITLPAKGWYLNMPMPYLAVAPIIMTIFTVMTTETGRSALLYALGGVAIILVGRKKVSTMEYIQRHFVAWVVISLTFIGIFSSAYKYLAIHGYINELAQQKYERQTKGKSGALAVLMGGRSELFMGIYACSKKPFWGFGPWNSDENGYNLEFLAKYGDLEAYEEYAKGRELAMKYGYQAEQVQSHSHIIGFWVRYGLLAFPFWLYILYCMYRHCRRNMAAIPHWYGYFALALPALAWHVIFSPYGDRVPDCLFITCLLIANAVRRGAIRLPAEMILEVVKIDPASASRYNRWL